MSSTPVPSIALEKKKRKRPQSDKPARKATKLGEPLSCDAENIELLEDQIKDSQRHYNNIVSLLSSARKEVKLSSTDTSATLALCRVFSRLQADGRLSKSQATTEKSREVVEWLKERYTEYKKLLLRAIEQPHVPCRQLALALAMQLVREDCTSAGSASDNVLKTGFFHQLATSILRSSQAEHLCEYLVDKYVQQNDDIRHHTLGAVVQSLVIPDSEPSRTVISNSLALLSMIEPLDPLATKLTAFFTVGSEAGSNRKKLPLSAHRKQGQQAWLALLSSALDKEQRKTVLGFISYRVIPWIPNVEVLMDFLTDSYNVGGATSLLALSGLFQLMQDKNLDYPDFFPKLYSLLDEQLLYSKHRSRFFRLLNTFMSSTHLPAAIAASFIKRLSRLSLHAPPAAIVAVIPWIYNMLKSHPTCTFMIHREPRTEDDRKEIEDHGQPDPFDMQEPDPMRTDAIESCLWELETLQSHYHPNVASLAKIISEQFTKASYNLEDFLDHSYGTLIDAELGRELKKTPVVEFDIPKTIFVQQDGDKSLEMMMTSIVAAK